MPKTKRTEFNQKGFDEIQWNKYFRSFQQEYIRKRLRAVKMFAENTAVPTISKTLSLDKNSVYSFLKLYLKEGFEGRVPAGNSPQTNPFNQRTRTHLQTNHHFQSSF